MFESIIIALIGLLGSIGVAFLGYKGICKESEAKQKQLQEESLNAIKKEFNEQIGKVNAKLENHRGEYLKGIDNVHDNINEIKAEYKRTVSIVELKIDNLEKKQDKHNNLVERTYKLESDVRDLSTRESVSEHRLSDLEKLQ